MKIILTIKDRIALPTIMPNNDDMVVMAMIRDIANKTDIAGKEAESIELETNLKDNKLNYKYNPEKAKNKDKEIDFSKPEIELLKTQLKRLDEGKLINLFNLDLCEKIRDIKIDSKQND